MIQSLQHPNIRGNGITLALTIMAMKDQKQDPVINFVKKKIDELDKAEKELNESFERIDKLLDKIIREW